MKPFDPTTIRYDLNCLSDPDLADRGLRRFPELCVKTRTSKSRTASPPPRRDDPNNLYEENRKLNGMRALGPPCKAGRPECREYVRNLRWEFALPDCKVPIPWERQLTGGAGAPNKRKQPPLVGSRPSPPRKRDCREGNVGQSTSRTDSQSTKHPTTYADHSQSWEESRDEERTNRYRHREGNRTSSWKTRGCEK